MNKKASKKSDANLVSRDVFRKNHIVVVEYLGSQQVYLFVDYTKLEIVDWFHNAKIGEAVSTIHFIEPYALDAGVFSIPLPSLVDKYSSEESE